MTKCSQTFKIIITLKQNVKVIIKFTNRDEGDKITTDLKILRKLYLGKKEEVIENEDIFVVGSLTFAFIA
jgi:hypothetical protein